LSEKQKEAEEEQEDLLVLLNELSDKRRGDEEKIRAANLEVSEDEGDEDGEEEE
jgi:intracellular protein transport protein USO1